MAGGEEADDPPIHALQDHPDFAAAIGMISVELSELEGSLAEVLRALLAVDSDVGQAIYFTPGTVIPRLFVLENVYRELHPNKNLDKDEVREIRKGLESIHGRAKAVMGKRHRLIHAAWGVKDGEVVYSPFPLKEAAFEVIKVAELKRVVTDIRKVNGDTLKLVDLIDEYRKTAAK